MFKNRFTCKICDRPMPPRVYEAHLKKSHTPEEVEGQIKKNEAELAGLTDVDKKIVEVPKGEEFGERGLNYRQTEVMPLRKPFDWGEVYACASCKQEFPAKAMRWHAKIEHGV